MPICYRCGKTIQKGEGWRRRKFRTGEYVRKRYPTASVAAVQTSYGQRAVCDACDRKLGQQEVRRELKALAELALVLAGLILLLWLNASR